MLRNIINNGTGIERYLLVFIPGSVTIFLLMLLLWTSSGALAYGIAWVALVAVLLIINAIDKNNKKKKNITP